MSTTIARPMRAIGLMSGTSMDGVDLALVDTDGESAVHAVTAAFRPYHPDERAVLRRALQEAAGVSDRAERTPAMAEAEAVVTRAHIAAVTDFMGARRMSPQDVAVIGFHGQTVFHAPRKGLTVQIGDGQALADAAGVPVVFDMRAADMAAGGEGAPLVPVYHRALAAQAGLALPVAILNIGGVSNLTYIGRDGSLLAFDTGPGNALLDDLVRERTGAAMDDGGRLAAAGQVSDAALGALISHPFFQKKPPKSLDRNSFCRNAVNELSTEDAAATLTIFTAAAVAAGLKHVPEAPRRLVVCGGGTRNPTLMAALKALTRVEVVPAEALGWSSDALEAEAFAYLAVRSWRGLPLTFPGTTGVLQPMTGGVLVRPHVPAAQA